MSESTSLATPISPPVASAPNLAPGASQLPRFAASSAPKTAALPAPAGKGPKRQSGDGAVAAAAAPPRPPKRRAPRACVSCRARKVRCDVIEGAPCGNCRWDKVECIVQENRRRKKKITEPHGVGQGTLAEAQPKPPSQPRPQPLPLAKRRLSHSEVGLDDDDSGEDDEADPASKRRRRNASSCSRSSRDDHRGVDMRSANRQGAPFYQSTATPFGLKHIDAAAAPYSYTGTGSPAPTFFPSIQECASPTFAPLPPFIRPLPAKIPPEDISFLCAKGALSIPNPSLQNALLRAYIEFVHPFMPLLDLHPLLNVINCENGFEGQVSLFLYHAVMFSATAFVDERHLLDAGYATRKAARRAFFQKTRLLYDFDYESDRVVLIQGLLLMTYWYETPDDQKDTWHWMGVAVSLAHTIGLHRNMEMTSLAPATRRLWKRIWWSCFMRDRLVALGMRRPTRIKDEDFDVPMLAESDFEIEALPEHITLVGPECTLAHSVEMQRELATMCVQKAKLCVCISHMLKTQYSVLIRDNMEPENTANSTMMLFPNKEPDSLDGVARVDAGLRAWAEALPPACHYRALQARDARDGRATIAVQRTLLHMAYHTTVSALHRPQFLPSSPAQAPALSREVQEMSRLRVKEAAARITAMAAELHHLRLERYLPTTGVTFILPAMIIHLLEMKSPLADARTRATRGFRQCMRVMGRLRDIYASADYATGFLDAALRKAAIDINANIEPSTLAMMKEVPQGFSAQTPPPESALPSYVPHSNAAEEGRPPEEGLLLHSPSARQAATAAAAASGPSAWAGREDGPAPMMIDTSLALNMEKTKTMAHSPPHTDDLVVVGGGGVGGSGPAGLTPRTANDSEGQPIDMDILDMDFSNGPDEIFDWNAISGTDLDLDQWLQFPTEGLNGEDMLL